MEPILRDFPDSFDTERLTIRAPRPGDGAEAATAIRESYAELHPWMPRFKPDATAEETEIHYRQTAAKFLLREELGLNLYLKGTDTFVGSIWLHDINWHVPRFEIGYWCRTRFTGQGYITEAVNGITAFAFDVLGARRLEIRCDSRNERSRRVAERAGYTLEATLRQDDVAPDGELRDRLIFAKLR